MTENPYESPAISSTSAIVPVPAIAEILPAWERLRVYYNIILLLESVALLLLLYGMGGPRGLAWLEMCLAGAVAANVCFCAGPCAEFYLCRLGLGGRTMRLMLFWAGTALSLLLVIAVLVLPLFPEMN